MVEATMEARYELMPISPFSVVIQHLMAGYRAGKSDLHLASASHKGARPGRGLT